MELPYGGIIMSDICYHPLMGKKIQTTSVYSQMKQADSCY